MDKWYQLIVSEFDLLVGMLKEVEDKFFYLYMYCDGARQLVLLGTYEECLRRAGDAWPQLDVVKEVAI